MSASAVTQRPRRALWTALWSLNSYVLPLLVTLAAMPFLYRHLGAAQFGVFTLAMLAPAIASNLDFGLAAASIRRSAGLLQNDPTRELGGVVASYAVVLLAIGGAIGVAVLVAAPWLSRWLGFDDVIGERSAGTVLAWCALWASVTPVLSIPGNLLRAAQQFGAITVTQTFATIATWGGAIALVRSDASMEDVVALAAITAIAAAVVGVVFAWPLLSRMKFKLGVHHVLDDVRFSSGLFLMQLASLVAYQVDRLLISSLLSPAAAGSYALCANLANKLMFAVSSLTGFAYPRAAAMAANGETAAPAQLLQMLVRNLLPLVASTIVPAILLAAPFFKLWLGPAYQEELVRLFQLLWIGFALVSITVPASHIIIGVGNSKISAVFAWLTALTSVVLLVILLPRIGLIGAGFAAIGAFSTSLVFLHLVRKALGVQRDSESLRVWVGCMVGAVSQWALLVLICPAIATWPSFLVAGIAAMAVFFSIRWLLRLVTREEDRLLKFGLSRLRSSGASQPPSR